MKYQTHTCIGVLAIVTSSVIIIANGPNLKNKIKFWLAISHPDTYLFKVGDICRAYKTSP